MRAGARRWSGWLLGVSLAVACGGRYDGEPADTGDGEGASGKTGTVGTAASAGKGPKPMDPAKGGAPPIDDVPPFSCGEGPGGFGNEGGLAECGGCTLPVYSVRCRSGTVFSAQVDTAEGACVAAQRESGEGGAGGVGGAAAADAAPPRAGAGGAADVCSTYVDPPRSSFVDAGVCLGWEDEDRVGECVVQGECCVVVEYNGCGL